MKAYVMQYVERLTDSYHSGGGLIVVAADLAAARALASNDEHVVPSDEEWEGATVYDLAGEPEPRLHIFPDAGCC